ncbi:hypothetical protein HOB87_15290 [Candidatus Woesearchaeota archaeon]|nr:hypothetical protein [Candidatus Woesearchaeota archaeon]
MIIRILAYSFLVLALLGCDEDKKETSTTSKYTGVWQEETSDNIIEIKGNGDVVHYECALSGDFTETILEGFTSTVEGDDIVWSYKGESFTAILEIDNNILTTIEVGEDPSTLKRLSSIPEMCDGNAIEISYISTTEVFEGEDTTFVIDLNYRLSEPTATIRVLFSGENEVFFFPDNNTLEISQNSYGSSSITVNHRAINLEGAEPYYIYVFMTPTEDDSASAADGRLLSIR